MSVKRVFLAACDGCGDLFDGEGSDDNCGFASFQSLEESLEKEGGWTLRGDASASEVWCPSCDPEDFKGVEDDEEDEDDDDIDDGVYDGIDDGEDL